MVKEALLTPYKQEHDEQTVAWLNSEVLRETFGLTYRPTLASHRQWLNSQINLHLMAIVYKGQHIGNASLRVEQRHDKAVLEIYLGNRSVHGQGLGKRALVELINFGFNELSLNRIELVTRKDNQVAESLYASVGFQLEGCERQAIKSSEGYLDQNLWSILTAEWNAKDV